MHEMNNIRIGNQSAFSAAIPIFPFEYAVNNGFNAFEWFPDKHESGQGWDVDDMDRDMRSHIRDLAAGHDIALSVHISLQADPRRPEESGLIYKDIQFAVDIGATLVNIHLLTGEGTKKFAESLGPVLREASGAGMKLSVENTPYNSPEDFNELFINMKDLGQIPASQAGMCFDIGHANLCEATRNDYLEYLDRLGPHVPIIHIHMHENYGDCDSHLPFFTGPAANDNSGISGFIDRIVKRNFSGSLILEQWPQPPVLLNDARDRLYAMLKLS